MTQRFDVNNKELNQRKFLDQNQHIISKKNKLGARFASKELDFTCTPPNDEEERVIEKAEKKDIERELLPEKEEQSQGLALDASSSDSES